jgi:hypothetical protein
VQDFEVSRDDAGSDDNKDILSPLIKIWSVGPHGRKERIFRLRHRQLTMPPLFVGKFAKYWVTAGYRTSSKDFVVPTLCIMRKSTVLRRDEQVS